MKRKVITISLVAILCFLLFGCGKKDTYTYVSFHDFNNGLAEEFPTEIKQEINNHSLRILTMDKTIFSGEITFGAEGDKANHAVVIGGMSVARHRQNGISLYIKDNKLHAHNGYTDEVHVIGQSKVGQKVNFSIRFDQTAEEEWEVTYNVGEQKTEVTYNQPYTFGNYIYIAPSGTAINVVSSEQANDVRIKTATAYDLSGGDYLLTGNYEVLDEAEEKIAIDKEEPVIKKPGDYTVLTKSGSFCDSQKVSLYKVGDVNLDGVQGDSKDLETLQALLKEVKRKNQTDSAAKYAADLNNDNKVSERDLELLETIASGDVKLADVVAKYHVPAITFDYLGGDEVMPILAYYGPLGDLITDEIFQLIKESGVNLINSENMDMNGSAFYDYQKALQLAEKYGIGHFVKDYALNPEYSSDSSVSSKNIEGTSKELSNAEMSTRIGLYSFYDSYLGTYIVDEAYENNYYPDDHPSNNRALQFFDWSARKMNSFTNNIGYMNLFGSQFDYKNGLAGEYDNYIKDCNVKLFSYDYYPFAYGCNVTGTGDGVRHEYKSSLGIYYTSLWQTRNKALEHNVPFWAYVEAGGDFRDGADNSETKDLLLPTEAETYWNVNNYLAFGAKGIEWFTLVQPGHFASEGQGYDYDRNGLIGSDGTKTPFYEYAANINKHIAAIDHVLMKSASTGIMAVGTYTIGNLESGKDHTLVKSTEGTKIDMLKNFTGGDEKKHGGILGCFDYGDTEAFYIVNDSITESQTFELEFNDSYKYHYVKNAKERTGRGSSFKVEIGPGEGVLVVLDNK